MKNDLSKVIQGEGFNEIVVDITRYNEIGLNCTDGCLDSCYVVLDTEKAKELVEVINIAITKIKEEKKDEEN